MIVDSSALAAIVFSEPDAAEFARALRDAPARMSAATYVEITTVIDKERVDELSAVLDQLLDTAEIEIVPFNEKLALIAREAHRSYGRRSGSRARLNLGDCFSYALARGTDQPLLYKGDDFTHTDVRSYLAEQAAARTAVEESPPPV